MHAIHKDRFQRAAALAREDIKAILETLKKVENETKFVDDKNEKLESIDINAKSNQSQNPRFKSSTNISRAIITESDPSFLKNNKSNFDSLDDYAHFQESKKVLMEEEMNFRVTNKNNVSPIIGNNGSFEDSTSNLRLRSANISNNIDQNLMTEDSTSQVSDKEYENKSIASHLSSVSQNNSDPSSYQWTHILDGLNQKLTNNPAILSSSSHIRNNVISNNNNNSNNKIYKNNEPESMNKWSEFSSQQIYPLHAETDSTMPNKSTSSTAALPGNSSHLDTLSTKATITSNNNEYKPSAPRSSTTAELEKAEKEYRLLLSKQREDSIASLKEMLRIGSDSYIREQQEIMNKNRKNRSIQEISKYICQEYILEANRMFTSTSSTSEQTDATKPKPLSNIDFQSTYVALPPIIKDAISASVDRCKRQLMTALESELHHKSSARLKETDTHIQARRLHWSELAARDVQAIHAMKLQEMQLEAYNKVRMSHIDLFSGSAGPEDALGDAFVTDNRKRGFNGSLDDIFSSSSEHHPSEPRSLHLSTGDLRQRGRLGLGSVRDGTEDDLGALPGLPNARSTLPRTAHGTMYLEQARR